MSDSVALEAPAKLNLFLRVLAREQDGFHGLETLFCLVTLADRLTATRRGEPGVTLEVTGADCGPAEDNLAVRAARMVLEATGSRFGVHLELLKRIPVRAGLGGGSSDGAAALQAVNQLAGNPIPRHELLQFAARLGSDVPFFLSGGPLALAWGHGDRMLRLAPLPAAPALLLVPPVAISTAEAYRSLDAAWRGAGRRGAVALDLEALSSWGNIGRLSGNDFEFALFGRHPEIKRAFEALAGTHPLVCRMTGSGATLFAVYRTPRERDDARLTLSPRLGQALPVETAGAWPAVPGDRL